MHDTMINEMKPPALVREIAATVAHAGGRAVVVGGAVRDALLGLEPKDFDLELFGINENAVDALLARSSAGIRIERVGRAFPVWKVWNADESQADAIDVALPRREILTGDGHTDFAVKLDPGMTFADASSRRDFTINAIGFDPLTNDFLDPHGGLGDLAARVLRHVSAHFGEDPLRVLRGMQFCARFGVTPAPETIAECQKLSPTHLSSERLFGEFEKLLVKGARPSLGLTFLRETGWLQYFPELNALVGVLQDPQHHPEGDAWVHTLHCVDALPAVRTGNEADDRVLGFAVLCHDLGKPLTTAFVDGRWRSHGHEEAGAEPTRLFMGRLTADIRLVDTVVGLVERHMVPKLAYRDAQNGGNADRAIRRLATKVRIDLLARVVRCDDAGRPPRPPGSPAADWLEQTAARLAIVDRKPEPLLLGRHLIAAGYVPTAKFGPVLAHVFELQLDGKLTTREEALAAAREILDEARA
jgi:tRNA nucleotidyltransferase (CCA-adding enzyme)